METYISFVYRINITSEPEGFYGIRFREEAAFGLPSVYCLVTLHPLVTEYTLGRMCQATVTRLLNATTAITWNDLPPPCHHHRPSFLPSHPIAPLYLNASVQSASSNIPSVVPFLPAMSQLRLPSFDQKVYALSKIVHRVKFQNNRSDHYTTTQRKHLRLLDDIALLLVTQSASDVAAVAFEQRQGTVVFYYAKNRLATTEELDYISRLTDLAQDIGETDRIELMFNAVLTVCLPKIMSRFDKLLSVLTKIPAAARAGTDDPDHELGFHLEAELGVWYNAQEGPAALVDNFLQHLRQLVASESQHAQGLQALGQIIRVAHATGSFKRRSMVNGQEKAEYTVYPDESLAKRMRLLGDYWGAVKRIVRHANSILTRRTVKFQMQQVCWSRCKISIIC